MMIWLLALVLMASLAGLGYRQGAIRVAFSFVAIIAGALVAVPLGRFLKPVVGFFGVKDPLLMWVLPPFIVFVIVSVLFKVAAVAVHRKVEVYYKYRAGDLRTVLWERLNRRLGLCLGQLNAVSYLILICFVIYFVSYATIQVSSANGDPRWMRIVNRFGEDLQSTGFNKAAASIAHFSPTYYEAADLAGLLYSNPLLEARVSRYPAFLGLAEQTEFKSLGSDKGFAEMRQRGGSIKDILEYPQVQTIVANPEMLKNIWGIVKPDMTDLRTYLETGRSAKYDPEKILGRWSFDTRYALILIRRAKPNISSKEMRNLRTAIETAYANTSLVATPDNHIILKNVPQANPAGGQGGQQTLQGEWAKSNGKYEISLSGSSVPATVDSDRLKLNFMGMDLVFDREI